MQAFLCPEGKELEIFERVRTGLTEHNRAWNNVASSRNRRVRNYGAVSLSLQLLQVNALKLKVSLPKLPMDDHISHVIAAFTANDA